MSLWLLVLLSNMNSVLGGSDTSDALPLSLLSTWEEGGMNHHPYLAEYLGGGGRSGSFSSPTTTTRAAVADAADDEQQPRSLAPGDWDELNTLLAGTTISLPDTSISGAVSIGLSNMECQDLAVDDILLTEVVVSNAPPPGALAGGNTVYLDLQILGVRTTCNLEYDYTIGFWSGDGLCEAHVANSNVSALVTITQPSLAIPPNEAQLLNCISRVDVTYVNFADDILAWILNILRDDVATLIEAEVNPVLCDLVTDLDEMATNLLVNVSDWISPYLDENIGLMNDDEEEDDEDSLYPTLELGNYSMFNTTHWLNFQDPQEGFGSIVQDIFTYASSLFSATSTNPNDGRPTLGINDFVESFILDANNVYKLPTNTLNSFFEDGILIVSSLDFLVTVVQIDEIRLGGLNTFTRVEPFTAIDNYTVSFGMGLERLIVEADIVLELESLDENNRTLNTYKDKGTMSVELDQVDFNTTILMAVDLVKLEALTIGSLVDTDQILGCFLGTLDEALNIPTLSMSTNDLLPPVITGFLSPGVDKLIDVTLDAVFPMYDIVLEEALPNFVAGEARELLVGALRDYTTDSATLCNVTMATTEYVDFRDLFLEPEEARRLGGTGREPFGNLGVAIKGFIETELVDIDPTTGLPRVNGVLIDPITESQSNESGTLRLENVLSFHQEFDLETLSAVINLTIPYIQVTNLDTIGSPLNLISPLQDGPYLLDNDLTMGIPDRPLKVDLRLALGISDGRNDGFAGSFTDLNITMELVKAQVDWTILLQIISERLLEFPLGDLLNWDCWLATIATVPLDERGARQAGITPTAQLFHAIGLELDNVRLYIACNECTDPQVYSDINQNLDENQDAVMDSTDMLLQFGTDLLEGEFIQYQIDLMLQDAAQYCPHRDEYDPNASPRDFSRAAYQPFQAETNTDNVSFLLTVTITILAIVILFFVIRSAVRCFVRRRHRVYLRSLPPEKVYRIYHLQSLLKEREERLNHNTTSMFMSDQVPFVARYLIPFCVVANIGFFLSGHLNIGGSVEIIVQFAGEVIEIDNFFEFSIARSTIQLWEAGGRELAILILLASGVWPYSKMLATLYLFFVPPRWMSVTRRGNYLLLLDFLAKWSTVDIFVLVISLVAFRISIRSPDLIFLPDDLYSIDLVLVLKWGIYANMIAQLVSQITSHYIIHYHRKIVQHSLAADTGPMMMSDAAEDDRGDNANPTSSFLTRVETGVTDSDGGSADRQQYSGSPTSVSNSGSEEIDVVPVPIPPSAAAAAPAPVEYAPPPLPMNPTNSDAPPEVLKEHHFSRPHRGENDALEVRTWIKDYAVWGIALVLVVLLLVGCIIPAYSFDYLGLLGLAIEFGQDFQQAIKEYSVFGIAGLLMQQATFLGEGRAIVGMFSLVVVFILTVLLVPLLQTAALVWQWMRPLSRQARQRWVVVLEILQAWQYVEVFVIAVLVSAWQLGSVSEYFLNDYCDDFVDALAELAYFGIIEETDAQCFRVTATIQSATYLLVVVAFVLSLFNAFVMQAIRQYEREQALADQTQWHELHIQKTSSNLEDDFIHESDTLEDVIKKIDPVQALFTDSFRWMLTKCRPSSSSPTAMSAMQQDGTDIVTNSRSGDDIDERQLPLTSSSVSELMEEQLKEAAATEQLKH